MNWLKSIFKNPFKNTWFVIGRNGVGEVHGNPFKGQVIMGSCNTGMSASKEGFFGIIEPEEVKRAKAENPDKIIVWGYSDISQLEKDYGKKKNEQIKKSILSNANGFFGIVSDEPQK
jgi:hypothetical protein